MVRRHFDDPPDDDYTDEVEVDDVDPPEVWDDPDAWVDGQTAWERARGY